MTAGDGTAALAKALTVLDMVGATPHGLTNADLLARAGLPKTTLYRILATLIEHGLLRRDPTHRVYRLGFRYLELVRNSYLMPDLVAAAAPELRTLRDLTGETTYLAALDGSDVISLERCDGAHSQRSSAALGRSKPVYCTGQGKAILSCMPRDDRDTLLRGVTMTALTPRTITDRRRLQVELRITAARGYAIDDEEIVLGVRCVAAPILDREGRVRGALSVAGPAWRMSLARLELLGPELVEAARRVGAQLQTASRGSDADEVAPASTSWAFHGAFPVWWPARGTLFWADTLAPAVRACTHTPGDTGSHDRIVCQLDAPITGLQLRPEGLLVAQVGRHLVLGVDDTLTTYEGTSIWNDPDITLLGIDPSGYSWAWFKHGTHGQLGFVNDAQRFEAVWKFSETIDSLTWSADGTEAYAAASSSGTLYMLKRGSSSVRRFASMPPGSGRLSAVALDDSGGIWAALRDGWSLMRFSADGALERIVSLPVAAPTGLAFVPADSGRATLYVTSDRNHQPIESLASAPLSGHLLRLRFDA
ncbi:IclR family transcriptional regulator C-terminal domain-containing protein [Paraburkholderia sp. Ac-20347]|uniref:IclR family transcriptional regulator domain-containing protein n=1 Tax=Paraburkholderia sp. Ac-20347 TaxID=2703892 RepID=UPI001981FD16|nr:IclR family transcriptional regulator C-terminal domain-containing protein [Paraburkholderia sp. Ac-20347]MBN3807614.1 helix-turn-helix domain-containing protein [Paraburkholderia sp. Ac-20347]